MFSYTSVMKAIGKWPHSWPKDRYSWQAIHYPEYHGVYDRTNGKPFCKIAWCLSWFMKYINGYASLCLWLRKQSVLCAYLFGYMHVCLQTAEVPDKFQRHEIFLTQNLTVSRFRDLTIARLQVITYWGLLKTGYHSEKYFKINHARTPVSIRPIYFFNYRIVVKFCTEHVLCKVSKQSDNLDGCYGQIIFEFQMSFGGISHIAPAIARWPSGARSSQ